MRYDFPLNEAMSALPPVLVTHGTFIRLSALADALADQSAGADLLSAELDRAQVVSAVELPPDVVTMGSTLEYVDLADGKSRVVTLVYPHEADIGRSKVAVTAPVGAALIGLCAGDTMAWTTPMGSIRYLRVIRVISQTAEQTDHPDSSVA